MNLAPSSATATRMFEILNGPARGFVFPITTTQLSVGRSPENDLVIDDPKCSRVQFTLQIEGDICVAKDVSNKNALYVNGKKVKQAQLNDGDVLTVGDTEIKFRDVTAALQTYQSPQVAPTPIKEFKNFATPKHKSVENPHGSKRKHNSKNFYLIVAGVGALVLYLMLSNSPNKKNDIYTVKTSSDAVAQIEKLKKSQMEQQEKLRLSGRNSRQYIDAQAAFIRGFRDYQNGQFALALRSFHEALAIYPMHAMAEHYRKLAEQRIQEYIQNQIDEGRLYRQRNNYNLCSAAYRRALDALGDNKMDLKYKIAESGWQECQTLLQGRF